MAVNTQATNRNPQAFSTLSKGLKAPKPFDYTEVIARQKAATAEKRAGEDAYNNLKASGLRNYYQSQVNEKLKSVDDYINNGGDTGTAEYRSLLADVTGFAKQSQEKQNKITAQAKYAYENPDKVNYNTLQGQ